MTLTEYLKDPKARGLLAEYYASIITPHKVRRSTSEILAEMKQQALSRCSKRMFIDQLGEAHQKAIAAFVAVVEEAYDPDNEEHFAALIDHALLCGVNAQDLADRLEVSPATVSRWRRGVSVPARLYRVEAKVACVEAVQLLRPKPTCGVR